MRIFVAREGDEGSEVGTSPEGCQYQLFKDDEVESMRFMLNVSTPLLGSAMVLSPISMLVVQLKDVATGVGEWFHLCGGD